MLSTAWSVIVAGYGIAAEAHTVVIYPGWRGDNLKITEDFPFGMQWAYPCQYSSYLSTAFSLPLIRIL
jgi:hypothetical protein